MEILIAIVFGLVLGVISTWLITLYKLKSEKGMSLKQVEEKYVVREICDKLQADLDALKAEVKTKDDLLLNLNREISSKDQIIKNTNEKLEGHKKEIEDLQQRMIKEFENIANRVLENRSGKFLETSTKSVGDILAPLNDKIIDFRKRLDDIYNSDTVERTSLKGEIKNLMDLNKQLSDDANNLASALKGESKTQGNWGEHQLEMILERVGLTKGIHFKMQESFDVDDGKRSQPDCVVYLPDNKHLIIDSKISLVAFERYFNAETDEDRATYASQHFNSVVTHIRELNKKSYQNLYQINPPDYVLMFIAYESALALATKVDTGIFQQALDKDIVLVTGSTLLATLKTIAYIWKQENQKKHVIEIARQGGQLYDKFVAFINDLKEVGSKIEQAKVAHELAMNKLTASTKKGDTLIGRAERIRLLGAKTTKLLPQDMLDQAELSVDETGEPEKLDITE